MPDRSRAMTVISTASTSIVPPTTSMPNWRPRLQILTVLTQSNVQLELEVSPMFLHYTILSITQI
jgi:hypothetical protein